MSKTIEDAVRSKYAAVALSGLSSEQAGVQAVAEAFGYSPEELRSIPAEANLGVSCGNPTAFASLKPGEVVVDLGSGGGLDVFLAARQVGPTGKAIGIDMTQEMIDLARRNLAKSEGAVGRPLANVEFHLATIDRMPLPDASADCVISNCVLNLVPDKPAALREIARILKPGGRLAVSDIALKRPLPPELGRDLMAYVGCIAGAIPIEDYRHHLLGAGFAHVEVVETGADLNAYAEIEERASCCGPAPGKASLPLIENCCSPAPTGGDTPELLERMADLLRRYDVNDYAASVRIYALKPHRGQAGDRIEERRLMKPARNPMQDSRQLLSPRIAAHLETLAMTLDPVAEPHRSAGQELAAWIAASDGGRSIIVVCTGNSRRSLLGALMGQAAATYYGLPRVRFFSGGTAPSTFNPRAIRALRAISFEIEPIGEEAPRGEPNLPNLKYRVRWGAAGSGLETIEFSKPYSDPSNPRSGFAALMVCDEANADCPVVSGAELRLAMPFPDPKAADDTPDETARYAATRDAFGRLMIGVLAEAAAKRQLA